MIFKIRVVNDTFLLMKCKNVKFVLKRFKNFSKNFQFTVNIFGNCVPHSLDIEIYRDVFGNCHKDSQTGKY